MVIKHTNTKRAAQSSRLAAKAAARAKRGQPTMSDIMSSLQRMKQAQLETDKIIAQLIAERDATVGRTKRGHVDQEVDGGREVVMDEEEEEHSSDMRKKKYSKIRAMEANRNMVDSQPTKKTYKEMTPLELAMKALVMEALGRSPFTKKILNSPNSEKVKLRDLPVYEGDSDPVEHIYMFQQKLSVGADDALQCRAFPLSLRGGALTWFRNIPEGTVDSFTELCELFITQYMCFMKEWQCSFA